MDCDDCVFSFLDSFLLGNLMTFLAIKNHLIFDVLVTPFFFSHAANIAWFQAVIAR